MAFITDVSLLIDEGPFKDPHTLKKVLQPYSPERKGSCYKVTGTFDQMENLSARLSAVRDQISPPPHRLTDRPSAPLRSVEVSRAVMDFMELRCAEELKKITGESFFMETQPDASSSSVRVTFKPRHVTVPLVRIDFIRQRFISLYQKTASDLQTTSVSRCYAKDLQTRFPQLLFAYNRRTPKMTVTGHFVHVAHLKEYLLKKTASSSRSPETKHPSEAASSRRSGPEPEEEEQCPICMESIKSSDKESLKCKHSFCRDCLKKAFTYKPICPTCGTLYGVLKGTQPDGGTMKVTADSSSLPGYERSGTLIINYYIPSGIQKEEHPNPGQRYEGVYRTAYLPDSTEGRRILKLLQQAFDQRLIFTVGRSTTSGRNNMVTWNDIHHKTSTHGGPSNYGYPDPDYLSRVRDELRVKGIE